MFDVFISYKSEERAEAIYVKNFLQANGLTCWMDQDQITIGRDYEKDIAAVMPDCRSLVLLLSYVSQASKEVKIEYELAKANSLYVFPVKIEDCDLSEYYDEKLKHTQVAKEYWKSEQDKQKILCSVRDALYELKGEPIRTAEDFLNMRIDYYQTHIQEIYDDLIHDWDSYVRRSVERCGFMTPEPHFIKGIITEAVKPYQDLVNTYIEDAVVNSTDTKYLNAFCDFILDRDIVTKIWIPFDKFINVVLQQLTSIDKNGSYEENAYLLRIYKDYLGTLNSDTFQHPVVKLCQRLYKTDAIRYEMVMSQIQYEHSPSFIDQASLAIYINPRYIGEEYINISSLIYIDDRRSIFKASDITPPIWSDFLRKFSCDMLMQELEKTPGASVLTSFFVENAFFTSDEKFNYMYLYLIFRWIESGHPEYVKVFLRNLGHINWNIYVDNTDKEISILKRFYRCCMLENGYEMDYINKLWKEA